MFVHGAGDNSRIWQPQIDVLADEFTVVAWDEPGAGRTSSAPSEFDLAGYASCLGALIEALELGPSHIAGLSWGGTIALELYRLRPELVATLILADTYAGWKGSLPEDEVRRACRGVRRMLGVAVVEERSAVRVLDGDVRCLVRTGALTYAGTNGAGVMRSDDGGTTWRRVGLEGIAIRSLGADGDTVLAGSQPVRVHRSDDDGTTWRALESFPRRPYWWRPAQPPHRQGYVSALAVEGETILAGIEAFRGFRSTGGGRSWHALRRGFSGDCHALLLAHGCAY